MGYLEFVDLLLGEEVGLREGRRFRTALKLSGLPAPQGPRRVRLRLPTRPRPPQGPRPRRPGVRRQPRQHRPARPARGRQNPPRGRARRRRLLGRLLDLLHQPRRSRPATPRRRSRRPVRQEAPDLPTTRRPRPGRGRLPAAGPGRGEHGLPADQPPLRTRHRDPHQQQGLLRVGHRLRRRRPGHRHPRPAPAPLPRHQHQRPQLPAQRPRVTRPHRTPCHDPPAGTDTSGRTPTDT